MKAIVMSIAYASNLGGLTVRHPFIIPLPSRSPAPDADCVAAESARLLDDQHALQLGQAERHGQFAALVGSVPRRHDPLLVGESGDGVGLPVGVLSAQVEGGGRHPAAHALPHRHLSRHHHGAYARLGASV